MVGRIPIGISGIDKMLYGGVPEESQVLITGGPGAGKTLFSFEYLYRNAKAGNRGILFALEEDTQRLVENVKSAFPEFTDIDELIKSGMLSLNDTIRSESILNAAKAEEQYEFGTVVQEMEQQITGTKAKCVVIDSLSVFDILVRDQGMYRKHMLELIANLRRLGVTSLMTIEMESPERDQLVFKPEYFIFDGIVALYQTGEESKRILATEILKMRGTKHSYVTTPYDITPSGFRVFAAEDIAPY